MKKFHDIFFVKALSSWNNWLINAGTSIFSVWQNFVKYYVHAKFQVNWTVQTETTGGEDKICPTPPSHTNLQRSPTCLWLKNITGITFRLLRSALSKFDKNHIFSFKSKEM